LQRSLADRHVELSPPNRLRLTERSVTFLATGPGVQHNDFMTQAWVRNPLTAVLSGIEGFRLPKRQPRGSAKPWEAHAWTLATRRRKMMPSAAGTVNEIYRYPAAPVCARQRGPRRML